MPSNLDHGTGKIRGIYLDGNEAARPIFREWLAPFRDVGASTVTSAFYPGISDNQTFDILGLPGFAFIQDEIEYETRTHHSNQDVFDRIQADDLKQNAVIMAVFIYNAAMSDEKVPRKPIFDKMIVESFTRCFTKHQFVLRTLSECSGTSSRSTKVSAGTFQMACKYGSDLELAGQIRRRQTRCL